MPTLRDKIQIEKQKENFAIGMIRKPMIELLEIYRKEKEV